MDTAPENVEDKAAGLPTNRSTEEEPQKDGVDKAEDSAALKAKIGQIIAERVRENQDLLAVQEKIREVNSMLQKLEREKITRETRLHELALAEQDLRKILAGPVAAAKQQQREQLSKRTLGDAMSHIRQLGQQALRTPGSAGGPSFHSTPAQTQASARMAQPFSQPPPPPMPRMRNSVHANPQSAPAQLIGLASQQRGAPSLNDYRNLLASLQLTGVGGGIDAALLAGIGDGASTQITQQSLAYMLHSQAQAQAQAQAVLQQPYDGLLGQTRALTLDEKVDLLRMGVGGAPGPMMQQLNLFGAGGQAPYGSDPEGNESTAFQNYGGAFLG